MLNAEIIAIGSELLTPDRTDTNGLWLTGRLAEIGVAVRQKTIVGDDAGRLEESIKDALSRSEIVILTGGLGPTEDDITRRIAAASVGRDLVFSDAIADDIRARFRAFGREMPEINLRQAYVIDGADVLPNPNGTAVGMFVDVDTRFLIILPGPPRENQPMFDDFVFERIRHRSGAVVFRKRILKISGMGESAIDEAIAPIYGSFDDIETSILFNRSEVEVHLTCCGTSVEIADARNAELADRIAEKIGTSCFSTDGEEMEQVIGRLLAARGETVSVAESCTGGLISQRLTDVPGSSAYFMEGVVSYANDAKVRLLGVSPDTLGNFGAVSAQTAEEMAQGMRLRSLTTYSVSVTGIAGPDGGTPEKPVGTVFLGYSDETVTRSFRIVLPGDRFLVRWRASQAALDFLRRQILKKYDPGL